LQNDSRPRPDYYRSAIPLLKSFERKELLVRSGVGTAICGLLFVTVEQRGADFASGFLTAAASNVLLQRLPRQST
jgi:hypothetical protein